MTMKRISIVVLLVLAYLEINAQDYKKWNVNLNFSSYINSSIIVVPGVNYSLSNSVEVGFMPSYYHNIIDFGNGNTSETTSWGGLLIGKYYIFRENVMDPYGSLIVGYGSITNTISNQTRQRNNVSLSIFLGNELQIGKKGWNFDFNVGLIYNGTYHQGEIAPIYTIGVKKRFLKNE